jgi:hypothetical protein
MVDSAMTQGAGRRRLSESHWFAGIDGMIADLHAGRPAQQAMLLREAMHLMIAAPAPLAAWLGPVADVESIECLLAAEASESAALALIPDHAGYMLSRGCNGVHLASVILPGMVREKYVAEGSSAALALLGAFVAAMRDVAGLLLAGNGRLN